MAVHAEPGLLTGGERLAHLDQARPNPCLARGAHSLHLRAAAPCCPALGALVWRKPCGAWGGGMLLQALQGHMPAAARRALLVRAAAWSL